MYVLAVCLTIGIIAGFGLLLYGVFFQKNETRIYDEAGEREMALERIQMSVEEADNTLSNINSVSSLIIEEIDIKYKELLFLYQMLEEKKKELLEQTVGQDDNIDDPYGRFTDEDTVYDDSEAAIDPSYYNNLEILEISRKMDEVRRFPKLHNKEAILELHSKGYDFTQIAKELAIGKGEVKLIIGLNKVGAGND